MTIAGDVSLQRGICGGAEHVVTGDIDMKLMNPFSLMSSLMSLRLLIGQLSSLSLSTWLLEARKTLFPRAPCRRVRK